MFALWFSLMVLTGAVLLAYYTVYSEVLEWGTAATLMLTLAVEFLGVLMVVTGFLSPNSQG
jgi:hypothetical protein